MPPSSLTNRPAEAANSSREISPWLIWGGIAVLWLPASRQWSYDWSTNPQYFYGWAVPFLAAFLIYDRWTQRPTPGEAAFPRLVAGGIVFLAFLQLPVRWFGEANSDWWPVWWAYAFIVAGCSFGILYLFGGKPWIIYFGFPILFMLTAVAWPTYFEIRLVQRLMAVNAEISAEIVSLMGIPVMAVGNTIHTPGGVLGVNEACSGIRSLQSTLMAAFFLSGLYRLALAGGILLVGVGAAIAFICNVVRTTFLTYQGALNGTSAVDQWHDTAGFVILGVVLVFLFVISQFLDRRSQRIANEKEVEA